MQSLSSIKKSFKIIVLTSFLFLSSGVLAEDKVNEQINSLRSEISSLQNSLDELNKLLKSQQQQIEQLKSKSENVSSTIVASAKDSSDEPVSIARASQAASNYLPNIGVVADIVGSSTQSQSDEEGNDRFAVREVEFVFSHDVDPYTSMNVVTTFSDYEDPSLEEANITYFGLPADIKARVGRFRPRIGKANAIHRDALDTVDEPLVIQRYFGIEGMSKTGLEASTFTPFSTEDYTQELIAGFIEGGTGEEGELFVQERRNPTLYTRLTNFIDISDSSSFELGGTFLNGAQDSDSQFEVKAFGIDATYSHFFNSINKIKLQSEAYFQNRGDSNFLNEEGVSLQSRTSPYGLYALADYRLAQRWAIGFRYDYVQPTFESIEIPLKEQAYSPYVTFLQSEFARWRLQYQRLQTEAGDDDNRFFLQGTFAIGTHKHALN